MTPLGSEERSASFSRAEIRRYYTGKVNTEPMSDNVVGYLEWIESRGKGVDNPDLLLIAAKAGNHAVIKWLGSARSAR